MRRRLYTALAALFIGCATNRAPQTALMPPEHDPVPPRPPLVVLPTGDISPDKINDAELRNVWIVVYDKGKYVGKCSGFIVRTDEVVTAKHCSGDSITVDGAPALLERVSLTDDLALIHAVRTDGHVFPPLEINETPQIGDLVYSVANHGIYRGLFARGYVMFIEAGFINDSLVVAPGVSGAAVYDKDGKLAGMSIQIYGTKLNNGAPLVVFNIGVHPKRIAAFLNESSK